VVLIQGTVSKQVINGSKTAVMDIIGILFVLLGSSAVQLHDSLGRRCICACSQAGFSSQNGNRYSGLHYQRAVFCAFFGQRDSVQWIFIKICFLFAVGNVCHIKRLTTRSRNSLKEVLMSQMMPDQVRLLKLQQKQLCSW
jgi:hypothetical protein